MSAPTTGRVISLDRGYPLVKAATGETRAQHSIDLVKNTQTRAAVGDFVDLVFPLGQDTPLITRIHERHNILVRKALVESKHEGSGKHEEQVLAANIDLVFVVQSLGKHPVDLDYLERQLVMAHQSGAQVAIVLTKADLATHREQDVAAVSVVAHNTCTVIIESAVTGDGLDQLRALLGPSVTGVMLGKSGVGKSTLINELLGAPLLATAAVRAKDRAGRHTTVARRMVFLDNGAALIDAPGLRTIGLYDAHRGLAATFPEIASKAASCHYRNCTHTTEPHCAVTAAVADGGTTIAPRRLDSYRSIAAEVFD